MGSKESGETDSPSASSVFLPLGRKRRGSVISIASQIDKETLNQALNQIHNAASQSETLTTFNEFTSPPATAGGSDGKAASGDLQGGISGLYSRIRATVGGSKDRGASIASGDVTDGDLSAKSSKIASSTPTAVSKQALKGTRSTSAAVSVSSSKRGLALDSPSTNQSLLGNGTSSDSANGTTQLLAASNHSVSSSHASGWKTPTNNVKSKQSSVTYSVSSINAAQPSDAHNILRSNLSDHSRGSSIANEQAPQALEMRASGVVEKPKFGVDKTSRQSVPASGPQRENVPSAVGTGVLDDYLSTSTADPQSLTKTPDEQASRDLAPRSETPYASGSEGLAVATQAEPTSKPESSRPEKPYQKPRELSTSEISISQGQRPIPAFRLSHSTLTDDGDTGSISSSVRNDDMSDQEAKHTVGRLPPRQSLGKGNENPRGVSGVISQISNIRNRVLGKEYWMRDENARDCFYCGDSFSTFRRKHHCRTCGQIFDAKCTSLVSGQQFGQTGTLRVCKPCESIINGYDDSSEYSDDGSNVGTKRRPRHGSSGANDLSPARSISSMRTFNGDRGDAMPTMAIPATRRVADESKRRSAVVEIDAEPRLIRPSSSRSLKSGVGLRSHPTSHKRHYSRSLLQRTLKIGSYERAPFLRNSEDSPQLGNRLPAFHSDNVIDPDLAPFISDDESSADEQFSIMETLNGDVGSKNAESDRGTLSGLLGSARKRSKLGEKSISGLTVGSRDADAVSLSSAKLSAQKLARRRNVSMSSTHHFRPSPRVQRFSSTSPAVGSNLHENVFSPTVDYLDSPENVRMTRSSSMSGSDAPSVELNNASIQHVRRLLSQLLRESEIPNVTSWEKALIPVLLQATDDVNPDVQSGDDMDIRHYVKLKKIPGGRPGDTAYVSGLIFTKNLALKSMPRSISHPNILILTFSLEYSRREEHFMSLEPVIRQEKEYLQNLVRRIEALRPHLLLVQRNVSGLALRYLEKANIATAYNVKPSVLEAISRCAQTRIITSVDRLAIKPAQAGRCESFYLKTYKYNGRKKTYMYLSGCPKELGCTITLRGADEPILAKIKRTTDFMIYVVYSLKLETCLMRDEFALIPTYTAAGSILSDREMAEMATVKGKPRSTGEETNGLAQTERNLSRGTDSATQSKPREESQASLLPPQLQKNHSTNSDEIALPETVPLPTFYSDMVESHKEKILSASPFVKFMQPYLLTRAREQERKLFYLKSLRDQATQEADPEKQGQEPEKFVLITPDMIHETISGAPKKIQEVLHAVQDAEYDKALHTYRTQKKQWESYASGNSNIFDPFAHQNIAVLYSVVCTTTSVPCSGPDLVALGFYNEHETDKEFEADCTLGQYVEDLCLGADSLCAANGCDRIMLNHHRQYVHGDAQISVTVEQSPPKLRGYQDIILMWSICRICGKETQVMPMSDNSWKYSFGKYLELSFWSSGLHAKAGICPHDLHRNHLRFFGFKNIAVRIQYDPITLLEIIVPRTRITWKVVNDLKFKNEVFSRAEDRFNNYMNSVKARIRSIKIDSVVPEKADACKQEIDRLGRLANEQHEFLINKLQDKYMGSKYFEIIPLNRALRALQEKVAEWDNAFTEFDINFFPSEKDIRRLATLQLKKIFLDRDDSTTSLSSNEDRISVSIPSGPVSEKTSPEETPKLVPQTRTMSPQKAHDMLTAVVENHTGATGVTEGVEENTPKAVPATVSTPQSPEALVDNQDIQHLDLPVTSSFTDQPPQRQAMDSENRSTSLIVMREGGGKDLTLEPLTPSGLEVKEAAQKPFQDTTIANAPRLSEANEWKKERKTPPTIQRAHSQPAHVRRERTHNSGSGIPLPVQHVSSQAPGKRAIEADQLEHPVRHNEKKMSERLGINALKTGINTHSMIPRSIVNRRKESRVSTLAKHFEQLSKEFEIERLRDKKQRASKVRRARAYPMAASKPIIEEYRNVHEAVEEREPSDEDSVEVVEDPRHHTGQGTAEKMAQNTMDQTEGEGFHAEDTLAEHKAHELEVVEEKNQAESHVESEVDEAATKSDEEDSLTDEAPSPPDSQNLLTPSEASLDMKLDLPKHEKNSLMKMLTNFWAERSASGWQPLEYPLNATDHVFADSDIIIREDEPSSLIAFALDSEDYKAKLREIQDLSANSDIRHGKPYVEDHFLTKEDQMRIERSLLQSTGTHLRYGFQEGSAKMLCKIFYAEQFDAVRRKCGIDNRIVESLSRCLKWDSKGGKTKSVFLKTLDDRLILKSLSQIETQTFLRFAPAYFELMGEALFHELPSVIAKMVGFYQVVIKNPMTGVEFNWFLLVMENLFYDRSPTRIFDLKGSMRNRRIQSTGEQNEVLLDENMVEFIYETPLFSREHSKRLLGASVFNDTLFLSRQDVMDYSLMVAIDEVRRELVVGIIDCIRTYTWDKKLESWIKDRGKNRPTVTSPKEYKNRFREAMGRYILQAPT